MRVALPSLENWKKVLGLLAGSVFGSNKVWPSCLNPKP